MHKTSVHTLVNSNIKELTHQKQQKSQKVILPASHWLCVNVLLNNITFCDFCCFWCVSSLILLLTSVWTDVLCIYVIKSYVRAFGRNFWKLKMMQKKRSWGFRTNWRAWSRSFDCLKLSRKTLTIRVSFARLSRSSDNRNSYGYVGSLLQTTGHGSICI